MVAAFKVKLSRGYAMEWLANVRRRIAKQVRNHPRLWNALNPRYRAAKDVINELRVLRFRRQMTYDASRGNDIVRKAIEGGGPLGIGKIGSLELEAVMCYLRGHDYSDVLRQQLFENVGLFPADRKHLDAFCKLFLESVDTLNILAAWGHPGESEVINRVPNRPLVRLRSFESWRHPRPWSAALAGKRVLVVTPFANSVMSQFRRREQIWRDQSILPPCELRAVRMPLSPGLVPPVHRDWRERYDALIKECDEAPYDIMMVGAGGLSVPMVAHAKASGRIGFHLGGHTQIFFGVYGKRWDPDRLLAGLRTPAWVRPSGDEAPPTVVKVEQGCYW
ncbi:MAG TPA: hypothetical protein VKG63_19500 [Steroidobacteraceae bacterium]|nr:hypothetical protein [Steroidobacteraceae bacterium]